MEMDAVVPEKTKLHASGHNTEFYDVLWYLRAKYPHVMPASNHVPACIEPLDKRLGSASAHGCINIY